jgi:hypothetical protein
VARAQARSTTLPLHYVSGTNTEGGLFRSPKVVIDIRQQSALPQYILSTCAATSNPLPQSPSLSRTLMIKFKSGSRDEFFRQLNDALSVKAWERVVTIAKPKVTAFGISKTYDRRHQADHGH